MIGWQRTRNVLLLVLALFLVVVPAAFADMTEEERELCEYVLKKYPESLRPMMTVEINSYKPQKPDKEVYLYVRLHELALGAEAKNIAIIGVKGALEWLVEKGYDPAKEWISVNCRPYMEEKGATGKELRRGWGKADYDWNTDQIEWVPVK
ncbi:hypothetical protein [Cloacibacillus porcorum]